MWYDAPRMTRLAIRLSVLIALLAAVVPAQAQGADGAALITRVDSAAFPAIDVYLAVNDAAGNHVAGLPAAAFALTEDSAPVAGAAAGEQETGVQVVFVLDTSSSMRGLPCVQIAPAYFPVASTWCTALAMRGSAGRGGAGPR